MRCEECQGSGHVLKPDDQYAVRALLRGEDPNHYLVQVPCHVCGGTGVAYCCDEAGANPPNVYERT